MLNNKKLFLSIVGSFLLALTVSQFAFGKAHVPQGQFQVCHDGVVKNVEKLEPHLDHGDCRLPACDFANVFVPGDSCTVESGTEGDFCNVQNDRESAMGATVRCSPGL